MKKNILMYPDITKEDFYDRLKRLSLMQNVAYKVNDQDLLDYWLTLGIPDGADWNDLAEIAGDIEMCRDINHAFNNYMNFALVDGLFNATEEEYEFAKTYQPFLKNLH